jgi:hypothetical protein
MILWITFGLTVFNTLWIITFNIFMGKLFLKLKPLLNNLRNFPIYGIMDTPQIGGDVKSE